MAQVKLLEWDTNFFGYNVGKLEVNGFVETEAISTDFKLVYLTSSTLIPEFSKNLVDKKATFILDLDRLKQEKDTDFQIEIVSFNGILHDYECLLDLTLESGVFSRYAIDENFVNDEYKKLYSKWIENSVNKTSAIDVFVAIEQGKILGFITLTETEEKYANLGLLAVATEARGKKVARSLINFVGNKALELGFSKLKVVTQYNNIPAVKLYESSGFKLKELIYIYHIWNHDTI